MAFLDSPQNGPQASAVRRASFFHEILGLVFGQLAGDSIHPRLPIQCLPQANRICFSGPVDEPGVDRARIKEIERFFQVVDIC